MILPLRRAHRSAFVALVLFLPALLASAWKVRHREAHQALGAELLPGSRPDDDFFGEHELVYWTERIDDDLRELPEDAELVGTVRSGALALPVPAGKRRLLYSLAHDRLFEDSPRPAEERD